MLGKSFSKFLGPMIALNAFMIFLGVVGSIDLGMAALLLLDKPESPVAATILVPMLPAFVCGGMVTTLYVELSKEFLGQ